MKESLSLVEPQLPLTVLHCDSHPLGGAGQRGWSWNFERPHWRVYWNDRPGGSVAFNGDWYELDPHHVVLIAPNTRVQTRLEAPVEHFFIHIALGYPYDTIRPMVHQVPVGRMPMHLVARLKQAATPFEGIRRMTPQLAISLRAFASSALADIPDDLWPTPADADLVDLIRMVQERPGMPHRLEDLAAFCAMSVSTFQRRFKDAVNMTPYQFVTQSRLRTAVNLLMHTNDSVEQIAAQCGFCDRYHLTRRLKAIYRQTPGAIRRLSTGLSD